MLPLSLLTQPIGFWGSCWWVEIYLNIFLNLFIYFNRIILSSQDVLGGIIVFISILAALVTFDDTGSSYADVKIIGMAINYTLMVPIYMNWIVKLLADMEKYMDAIRRIQGDVAVLDRVPKPVTIGGKQLIYFLIFIESN